MKGNCHEILLEIEIYQDNRDSYSPEERQKLRNYFKQRLKKAENYRDKPLEF